MMRCCLLLLLSCGLLRPSLTAQSPYTTPNQYAWRVDTNLVYGTAINYMGQPNTLRLDLYKPIGDHNLQRPLLVLVHGGTWLSGCKYDMNWLAEEMAGRGYVVATVNYRLGWHKDDNVAAPYCLLGDAVRNLYPADSCEILRALFRAQQDVKGAVRWLRCRHLQDSTSLCQVLVGGESAGGFISLAVGLLDRESEKPDCCYALADAPAPDPDLLNRTTMDCLQQGWTIPPGSLARPDLGSADGDLNQNGYDANVSGILSFFGGVPTEARTKDWLAGPDTPAIYLYHQTCDGVVPFNYGQPTVTISAYCNLGCSPWHYQYPHMYGNGAIAAALATLPDPPPYTTDSQYCDPFNSGLALFECNRYANNGSYHFTANQPQRAQIAAGFFSPLITAPPCTTPGAACASSTDAPGGWGDLQPAPNPFRDQLGLSCTTAPAGPLTVRLLDATGRLVWREQRVLAAGSNALPAAGRLPDGLYFLQVTGRAGTRTWTLVKSR